MRICDVCYRRHWRAKIDKKTGLQVTHKNGNRVFVCIYCGNVQEEEHSAQTTPEKIQANILYIDLEISKTLVYNYGLRVPSGYIHPDNLVKERYMISWAASYVGNDTVWSDCVTAKEAKAWNDKRITPRLWELMDAAEIIAGHNVQGFDVKHANTRFRRNGQAAIVGKKVLDTLKVARSTMAFESNSLDYIAKFFGLTQKEHVTQDDWLKALDGDEKTLKKIHHYNRTDVIAGKQVLESLLPQFNKKRHFGAIRIY